MTILPGPEAGQARRCRPALTAAELGLILSALSYIRGAPLSAVVAAAMIRCMSAVRVLDALAAGRDCDAVELVFEYMAATQAATGQPVPAGIGQLPATLARECRDLAAAYPAPGALLVAYRDGQPIGCVGLAPRLPAGTAEVKRLYVRPAHRGGIGRVLMSHAHRHAAQHGFTRLVLDVLPARANVIEFYRRLGYTEADPQGTESPVPMICMQRLFRPTQLDPEA
jgi:GNAT superfamily N-acetyltransferase